MLKESMIRVMRFEDLDDVYIMEQRLFPNPWPRYFFEKDLESNNTIALVTEHEGEVVGYALASCVDIEFHITNIAVDENHQHQGIASRLMVELEHWAKERCCTSVYLEVRTNNTPAINLYKKLGYDVIYLRKQYYIDGDDAYVMHKEL